MLVIYLFFLLQAIAFFTLVERHFLSLTQNRVGPKKNSYYGVLQPILDGIKLIKKEQIVIFNCSPMVFLGITALNFSIFYMEFLTLPYYWAFIFMNWGYLMVMLLLGLNLMCLMMGGIYSKSKYSYLGTMRAMVASVSYEIMFNLNMILFMLYNKSVMLKNVSSVGNLLFFFTFFISVLVELGRTPFDYIESESDLVSGFNTEYSSVSFVLLFLKEYGSLLFFSCMCSMLFFNGVFIGAVLVFSGIIFIRSSFPRLRVDTLMQLMWLVLFFHISVGLYSTYMVLLV